MASIGNMAEMIKSEQSVFDEAADKYTHYILHPNPCEPDFTKIKQAFIAGQHWAQRQLNRTYAVKAATRRPGVYYTNLDDHFYIWDRTHQVWTDDKYVYSQAYMIEHAIEQRLTYIGPFEEDRAIDNWLNLGLGT